jgi:hypothetical protein
MEAMPHWAFIVIHSVLIIAEVLDVLALVVIALGFSTRAAVSPVVPGALQHR